LIRSFVQYPAIKIHPTDIPIDRIIFLFFFHYHGKGIDCRIKWILIFITIKNIGLFLMVFI